MRRSTTLGFSILSVIHLACGDSSADSGSLDDGTSMEPSGTTLAETSTTETSLPASESTSTGNETDASSSSQSTTSADASTSAGSDTTASDATGTTGGLAEVCESLGAEVPLTVTGTTTGANDDTQGSCIAVLGGFRGGGPDVTYEWTAPQAGVYGFDLRGSAIDDTLIYLFDGGCDGTTEIACNEDIAPGFQSYAVVTLAADQTVAIVVDGWNRDQVGDFELNISQIECSPVDLGDDLGIDVSGTTQDETNDLAGTCGGATGPDIEYLWTAPHNGVFAFSRDGSAISSAMYIYSETCGDTSTELGCDAQAGELYRHLTQGQTVAIVIDGLTDAAIGTTRLTIDEVAGDHDCCSTGAAGCASPEVAECVCNTLPECCVEGAQAWSSECAAAAVAICGAEGEACSRVDVPAYGECGDSQGSNCQAWEDPLQTDDGHCICAPRCEWMEVCPQASTGNAEGSCRIFDSTIGAHWCTLNDCTVGDDSTCPDGLICVEDFFLTLCVHPDLPGGPAAL